MFTSKKMQPPACAALQIKDNLWFYPETDSLHLDNSYRFALRCPHGDERERPVRRQPEVRMFPPDKDACYGCPK